MSRNSARLRRLDRKKIIKKRIEMLLRAATMGLIVGLSIGILLPIGKVKKSDYKLLEQSNKKLKEEVSKLQSDLEESSTFTSLNDDKKSQVISYIKEISEESNNDISDVKTTELFKQLYKAYAYSVGYISFEDFKAIVDIFEFTYDIKSDNKFIFKDNESNDTVTLTFSNTEENNDLILNSLLYKRGNKYIEAINNNSIIEYKTYDGSENTVNNINDQIKFLFSE